MTIIVSIKIADGIVLVSDSMTTIGSNTYPTSKSGKIFSLVKGLPIGIITCGAGNILIESIATLMKSLQKRLDGTIGHAWTLNHSTYTMKEVTEKVKEFFYDEHIIPFVPFTSSINIKFRVCGYSAGSSQSEIWDLSFDSSPQCNTLINQTTSQWGIKWEGEPEPINRLILGYPHEIILADALVKSGLGQPNPFSQMTQANKDIFADTLRHEFCLLHMPLQDAIDLGRFLIQTAIGFVRFSTTYSQKTIGGAIDVAIITQHEGFIWIDHNSLI